MKRSPLLLSRIAPSPRQPSVSSTPAPATPVGVKLPELHVFQRNARTRRHAQAVAGVDEGVGGGGKDAAGAAGGQQRGLGFQDVQVAGFHLDRRHAQHVAIGVANQVQRHPLDEEAGLGLDVLLVQRVQHRVAGAVGRRAGALHRLFAVVGGVAAERGAGRWCRPGCGQTAWPMCSRSYTTLGASRHMYSMASWSPSQSEP